MTRTGEYILLRLRARKSRERGAQTYKNQMKGRREGLSHHEANPLRYSNDAEEIALKLLGCASQDLQHIQ